MLKRCLLPILVLLSTLALQAQAKKEITMLVVPRDAKAVQIAQDISRRYPVLLVSYQQMNDLLKLHAWNGESWIEISTEEYVNGAFFENQPQHAILVESTNAPSPEVLVPDGIWCASGNRLVSTKPHVMIHLLGTYFDFPYLTWKQFSRRYNEPMARINPALLNMRMWNIYGEDLWDRRDTLNPESDLEKWFFLDITPPLPIEPVVIEEEPAELAPVEIPATEPVEPVVEEVAIEEPAPTVEEIPAAVSAEAEETIEDILDALNPADAVNPFSTDDIPAAKVVLPE